MILAPMNTTTNLLNKVVDINYFNDIVTKNGGASPFSTKKNKMTMTEFIFNLVKHFRKQYDLKRKLGGYADTDTTPIIESNMINKYMGYSDLSFKSFEIEPSLNTVREIL